MPLYNRRQFVVKVAAACKRVEPETEFENEYETNVRYLLDEEEVSLGTNIYKARDLVFQLMSGPPRRAAA